jgi:hypothetical protein
LSAKLIVGVIDHLYRSAMETMLHR